MWRRKRFVLHRRTENVATVNTVAMLSVDGEAYPFFATMAMLLLAKAIDLLQAPTPESYDAKVTWYQEPATLIRNTMSELESFSHATLAPHLDRVLKVFKDLATM